MASLSLRIDLDNGGRIGPGKVALLEAIDATGSIAAGARRIGMSYKRAWDLVEELNRICRAPVLSTQPGGLKGGGAKLTETGFDVVRRFRAVEAAAATAAVEHLAAVDGLTASLGHSSASAK